MWCCPRCSGGTPYRLLDVLRQQSGLQLCSSTVLLEELADVITRPSATQRLALIKTTASKVLADYLEVIELIDPVNVPRIVPNDPDDDHVIACARAAHADLIVTGDEDLLSLLRHQHTNILPPAQALQLISS